MLFGGTKDGLKALQLKIAEKEKEEPDEEEVNTGFRNRARARRRGNQEVRMEGVVFFGDVAELRHALINMHNFSIYADLPHSPGSSFSSVQHLLQVGCRLCRDGLKRQALRVIIDLLYLIDYFILFY